MTRERDAAVLVPTTCELGEAPHWDADRDRLLWLDIDGRILHTRDTAGDHRSFPLDRQTSFVAPTTTGGLVAAGGDLIRLTDPQGAFLHPLVHLPIPAGARTNDGACDAQGRLWVGATDRTRDGAHGLLLRVDGRGHAEVLRTGITMSNGIDWNPAGDVAYHVDTSPGHVDRLELDAEGDITAAEPFVRTDLMPDGLAVDAEGGVWIAFWDGGAVHRYDADGDLDEVIRVDSGRITSCAFGPPGSTELFITTARQTMNEEELVSQPNSGALFVIDVGVAGRGVHVFRASEPGT